MEATESLPVSEPPPLRILKPDATDPDYLCDCDEKDRWNYRLAINHRDELTVEKRWSMQRDFALWAYRPLPQARKFHRSTASLRWALGGNRSSKSRALAVETLYRGVGYHPFRSVPHYARPQNGWYATTTFPKLGELWNDHFVPLLKGIKHRTIWHNKQYSIPGVLLIYTPIGTSKITFKAYEQGREAFQASAVDFIHFDEPFKQDVFIESISRIGADESADFAAALTPIEPMPWLEERLTGEPIPGDEVFSFPLDDNRRSYGGFIPDPRIDGLIAQWPPETRETRRNGKWGAFLGSVFQTFSRATHVIDLVREQALFLKGTKLDPHMEAFGSIDWGGNNPFVYLWATRIPWLDMAWYVFDEYYWSFQENGPRLLEQHATAIKDRTTQWGGQILRTWADHDPTDAREMAKYGVPSRAAKKGNDADEVSMAGIEHLQTLFHAQPHTANSEFPNGQPQLFIAHRCKNLIRELGTYRWEVGSDKRDPKRRPMKVNDHSVDALRYLVISEKRTAPSTAPIPQLQRYRKQF